MTEHPAHAATQSLPHPAVAAVAAMAPIVQGALVGLGLLRAAGEFWAHDIRTGPARSHAALIVLGSFVLAGWVAGRLLLAAAGAMDLFSSQVEAIARLARTLDRLGEAPEWAHRVASSQSPGLGADAAIPEERTVSHIPPVPDESRGAALDEIHSAIVRGEWAQVEVLLAKFAGMYPDDDILPRLAGARDAAKGAAIAALRERMDASREANDPERVIELREGLASLLEPEALRELDRDLARWLMGLVQKRLRKRVMTLDLAQLATRVAEVFDTTPEGASLRAALPTLRRSVGLCARCGRPYTGIADACPSCLATASFPVHALPSTPTDDNEQSSQSAEEVSSEAIDLDLE